MKKYSTPCRSVPRGALVVYETENLSSCTDFKTPATSADFPAPEGPETMIRLPLRAMSFNVLNLFAQLFDIGLDRNRMARDLYVAGLGKNRVRFALHLLQQK